jgi:molybdopterin synthase sulfur carrier subunit
MISIKFFATFREIIGKKEMDVEYREGMTVGDLLQELCADSEAMQKACFENGELRDYVKLLVNGHNIQFLKGLDTVLQDGDVVAIFPPVAGGSPFLSK